MADSWVSTDRFIDDGIEMVLVLDDGTDLTDHGNGESQDESKMSLAKESTRAVARIEDERWLP